MKVNEILIGVVRACSHSRVATKMCKFDIVKKQNAFTRLAESFINAVFARAFSCGSDQLRQRPWFTVIRFGSFNFNLFTECFAFYLESLERNQMKCRAPADRAISQTGHKLEWFECSETAKIKQQQIYGFVDCHFGIYIIPCHFLRSLRAIDRGSIGWLYLPLLILFLRVVFADVVLHLPFVSAFVLVATFFFPSSGPKMIRDVKFGGKKRIFEIRALIPTVLHYIIKIRLIIPENEHFERLPINASLGNSKTIARVWGIFRQTFPPSFT